MDLVSLVTSIATGIGMGGAAGGVAYLLLKREAIRVLEIVDRVPDREWFVRVEQKLDRLPDMTRLDDNFAAVHSHTSLLLAHSLRFEQIGQRQEDHEQRIRAMERA